MPSPEPKRAPGPKPADDGLDKIPMQKANPAWVVAGVVIVLVLGGLVGFSLFRGKKSTTAAALPNASLSAEPENAQLLQKAQREHAAMTQRALAALEEKKKQEAASAPPEVASDKPEAEKTQAAPKKTGGGPAPAADKLKDLGASIESQLK
jgi:hypothetical protein